METITIYCLFASAEFMFSEKVPHRKICERKGLNEPINNGTIPDNLLTRPVRGERRLVNDRSETAGRADTLMENTPLSDERLLPYFRWVRPSIFGSLS